MDSSTKQLFEKIDANQEKYIKRLSDTVAIKSVSAWPETRPEITKMVKWTQKELESLGATTELKDLGMQKLADGSELPLPPVLLATLGADSTKKTLLVYGHLDVQPASKDDGWDTEPFVLTEVNGKLYGRGSTDDKIKCENAKTGKNLQINSFKATSSFVSEKSLTGTIVYVADLISFITKKCPWVAVHKRKRINDSSAPENITKRKRQEKVIIYESETNIDIEMRSLDPVMFKDHFLGLFEVNVLTLLEPPKAYMSRQINQEWVALLKKKIMDQPHLVTTILPVLIDPAQVKEAKEFEVEKISSYNLWTIGGNHIRCALQQLAKTSILSDMRNINIRLYCGLSEEEAIQLGNMHNGAQNSLKPTFQDSVKQALKFKKEENLSAIVAKMLKDIEMREIAKESVGTICSVARYSEENLKYVELLFQKHEQKMGSMKSIPQTLFRELQGIPDNKRIHYLEEAYLTI